MRFYSINRIGASTFETISQNNSCFYQKYDILFFRADSFKWNRHHSTVVVVLATSSSNKSYSVIGQINPRDVAAV